MNPDKCRYSTAAFDETGAALCADNPADFLAAGKAAAKSANTLATYRSAWKSWTRWARARQVPADRPDPHQIQQWLADLYSDGKAIDTLRTYRAGVAWHLRHLGSANPADCPDVRDLLRGLARIAAEQGRTQKQAHGLRLHHIRKIAAAAHKPRRNQPGGRLETAEQAQLRGDIDIALIAVTYNAMLRCGETLNLIWADISAADDDTGGVIRIRRSKTDPTGQGEYRYISPDAYQAHQRIRPDNAAPTDPVFAMSPSALNRRLKAAAEAAGINPTGISSHSTRVGMAQDLTAAGIDLLGLMHAGRWTNAAIALGYTKRIAAQHTPAAQFLKTQRLYATPTQTRQNPDTDTKAKPNPNDSPVNPKQPSLREWARETVQMGTHAAIRAKQAVQSSLQDLRPAQGPPSGSGRGLLKAAQALLAAYRNPRINGRANAAGARTRLAKTAIAPMVTR